MYAKKQENMKSVLFTKPKTYIKGSTQLNNNVQVAFKPTTPYTFQQASIYDDQNREIVSSLKKNLIRCSDVNKEYKTLNKEFNYTINIVLNMVNLIENNGKLIEEIQRVLKEYGSDIIDSSQLEVMRTTQTKLIDQFKSTYHSLLLRNQKYIDKETHDKIKGLLLSLEKPQIKKYF